MGTPRGALLPWLVRQLDLHPARIDTWLGERRLGQPINAPLAETLLYFLLWWRDDAPVRTPDQLGYPLARHFRDRGLASLRTGWGPQDWLVSHVCGRQHHAGHRQGDANHVSFYALGESFLVDAGYGDLAAQADTTAPVDRWFGETAAHNCVLVDGASQRGTHPTPGWAEGELLDFQHRDAFATTLGDASSCTGPDHRVRQALRRVALVRGGPAPYLAVVDVNERDGAPFTATHLWHTDPTIRLDLLDAHRFSLTGRRGWCPGQVLWPPDASVTAGSDHGRPQLRLALHAGVTEAVTVFCPRRPGEAPPTFACERLAPGAFRIVCAAAGGEFDPDHQRRHRRPPARPASGAPRRDRMTRSTRSGGPARRLGPGRPLGVVSRPRFLADHDLNEYIITGVRRRHEGVEFLRVRDAGLDGRPDPEVLACAAERGLLVVSHDVNTMSAHAHRRPARLPPSGVAAPPEQGRLGGRWRCFRRDAPGPRPGPDAPAASPARGA